MLKNGIEARIEIEVDAVLGVDSEIEQVEIQELFNLDTGEHLELEDIEDGWKLNEVIDGFVMSNVSAFYQDKVDSYADKGYDMYIDNIIDSLDD